MHGFGAIDAEANEPPFHETWEGRAGGMVDILTFPPGFRVDRFRYLRETLRPDLYLTQNYYEQWLYIAEQALLEGGYITAEELARGRASAGAPKRDDAMRADAIWDFLHDRAPSERHLDERAAVRDRPARACPHHATGGPHPPAALCARQDRRPSSPITAATCCRMPARTERAMRRSTSTRSASRRANCGARTRNPRDRVHLDLWESYLEPA